MANGFVAAAISFLALSGFAAGLSPGYAEAARKARADLIPKSGSGVSGTVTFEEIGGGVLVRVDARGVSAGIHGFHVHEKGDCSSPDGLSAAGHYNPTKRPHGGPDDPVDKRHAGDLGNVVADAAGMVKFERVFTGITVGPGPATVAGRSVILHAQRDDLKSQPTGDAGGRIACGVIGITQD